MTIEELMKKCQKGVGFYSGSLDDANNLLAECYGVIGALSARNAIKANELAFLYGQEKIPKQYKSGIKKALDT